MTYTTHTPEVVVPDVQPSSVKPNQLVAALNVRLGMINQKGITSQGGNGTYRIPGNTEIVNDDLPAGQSWVVGACQDKPTGIIYFSLWNEDEDFNTIFKFTEPDTFEIVAQGSYLNFRQPVSPGAGFVEDYYVHMAYLQSGLLTFEDNLNEDRVINPTVAIAGGVYPDPIPSWMLAQLHRPPAFSPLLYGVSGDAESVPSYISDTIPKPITDVSAQGYQFGYNYGYIGNIESRISPPSIVNWNNGPYLLIPEEEFLVYMGDGTTANPYIEYVKFYYRLGNTGNWNQFRKINNETGNWLVNPATTPAVAAGNYFGLILPDMDALTPTGGTSAAALNLVDGVPIRSKGTIPAENKLVKWYPTFGYDFETPELPTITTPTTTDYVDAPDRNYRYFPPMVYKVEMAGAYRDLEGRVIGAFSWGTKTLPKPGTYIANLSNIIFTGGEPPSFFDSATWQDVVNYFMGDLYAQIDAKDAPYISIEPPAVALDSNVATVELLIRPRQNITQFMRTLCRPWFIYGNPDQGFKLIEDNQFETVTIDGIQFSYYGIGFMFNSGEPINFSNEQNYHIQVRGQTLPYSGSVIASAYTFDFDQDFEITDTLGNILISRQPYSNTATTPPAFAMSLFGFNGWDDNGETKGFWQIIADVLLYSETETPGNTWNEVPSVIWTKEQYEAQEVRNYYGDSFWTAEEKETSGYYYSPVYKSNAAGSPGLDTFGANLGIIQWTGQFIAMAMTGIYVEFWDSDIGSAVALNSEPKRTTRAKGLIRGGEYLPDTEINNQFVFDPIDVSQVNGNVGSITRVGVLSPGTSTGDNLYCICQSGSEIIFLGKTQIQSTSGEGDIALSTSLFGSHNTQPLSYGAFSQREVVFTGEGMAFYFDRVNNVFVQLSLAGQDPVSMQQFFVSDMADMGDPNQPTKHGAIGWDPLYTEVVYAELAEGFAYNAQQKKYQGKRTYGETLFTEMFQFSSQGTFFKQLYGFSNGKLYRFNVGTQFNGEDFTAKMRLVSVPGSQNHDFLRVQYLAGNSSIVHKWNMNLRTSNSKESTLVASDFKDRKQYFEASVKRDINEAGGKYGGAIMDGMWMLVELEDFDSTNKSLTFVRIGSNNSLTDGNNGG